MLPHHIVTNAYYTQRQHSAKNIRQVISLMLVLLNLSAVFVLLKPNHWNTWFANVIITGIIIKKWNLERNTPTFKEFICICYSDCFQSPTHLASNSASKEICMLLNAAFEGWQCPLSRTNISQTAIKLNECPLFVLFAANLPNHVGFLKTPFAFNPFS